MNKFRKLGFIDYDQGRSKVHTVLMDVLSRD
jgi:hypothetical protein